MNKILVVIDCQNDFISGSLSSEEAQRKIPNIVKKIKDFDGDVIYVTQDTHYQDYLTRDKESEKLPIAHCIVDTEGWEIEKSIKKALDEHKAHKIYIEKNTFGYKDIGIELSENIDMAHDNQIEIIGFCTNICVISNALIIKANYHDVADIYVIESCCAGTSIEAHEKALEILKDCQINIVK